MKKKKRSGKETLVEGGRTIKKGRRLKSAGWGESGVKNVFPGAENWATN